MQKIMFTKSLTRAVLEDLKTNTRRLIKVPDTWHGIDVCSAGPDTDGKSLLLYDADGHLIEGGQIMPRYKVGEIVAVAQAYEDLDMVLRLRNWKRTDTLYDAYYHARQFGYVDDTLPGWSNKMYVRADLMPHKIKINDYHVERLQDISDEDCLREGIIRYISLREGIIRHVCYPFEFSGTRSVTCYENKMGTYLTPREAFAALIKKMYGRKAWDDNPWTFAYDFTRIK